MSGHSNLPTHEVTNQSPELCNLNPLESDVALREAIHRGGAAWALPEISRLAGHLASNDAVEAGRLANRHTPTLATFDKNGYRIDRIDFHPSYHQLMKLGIESGISTIVARNQSKGAHVAHVAMMFLFYQVDAGVCCPFLMNYAAIPVLTAYAELPPIWLAKIMADKYDPRFIPIEEKSGATIGMAMTEKQGGSDVRSNSTTAVSEGKPGPGNIYRLTGHKWFCSAPMSDAFLTLAQTSEGDLSCFLVPRFTPDGTQNQIHVQRLKDKLGNRSNASSEIEYDNAWALLVGEEGRGVATIMEMVHHTRLDVAVTPAALMRRSLVLALHHANNRRAFQKRLIDQPLMRNVLAHLALDSEAATSLIFYAAQSFDKANASLEDVAISRFASAICKYWLNKRAGPFVHEALECLGGAGYVEENDLARIYREVPLHGIWEGCGNIVALDVLRSLRVFPGGAERLVAELRSFDRQHISYNSHVEHLEKTLIDSPVAEFDARRLLDDLAIAFQAGILLRDGPDFMADAFCGTYLNHSNCRDYGTLSSNVDIDAILSRALKLE